MMTSMDNPIQSICILFSIIVFHHTYESVAFCVSIHIRYTVHSVQHSNYPLYVSQF
jgi:hypothetical protein